MLTDEIYRDGKTNFTPDFKSVEPFPDKGLEEAIDLITKSNYIKEILAQKNVYGIIHILSHVKEAIEAERKIEKIE